MATIFYTSPDHKKRWLTAILTIEKTWEGKLDPEYASALYILTSRTGTWQQAQGYVARDGIDFEALINEVDFSGAYLQLIKLAGNLFNGTIHMDPVELYRLDEENFTLALTALQIRRVSIPLSEIAEKAELYNLEMDIRNAISRANRSKPWLPLVDGE